MVVCQLLFSKLLFRNALLILHRLDQLNSIAIDAAIHPIASDCTYSIFIVKPRLSTKPLKGLANIRELFSLTLD